MWKYCKRLAGQRPGVGDQLRARRYLRNNPRKYEVQRGPERKWLSLHDWFLPALYQAGNDVPLLKAGRAPRPDEAGEEVSGVSFQLANDITRASEKVENTQTRQAGSLPHAGHNRRASCSNVPPAPEAGFFGRRAEVWQIERWFAGPTRRITITGSGGQGKTALAPEAGRWLVPTGSSRPRCSSTTPAFKAWTPWPWRSAISARCCRKACWTRRRPQRHWRRTPTLVILDNLEALAAKPLAKLLDAAVGWSAAGGSPCCATRRRVRPCRVPDRRHAGSPPDPACRFGHRRTRTMRWSGLPA